MEWTTLANDEAINKTADSLRSRGFEVDITADGKQAREMVLGLIPKGAEVLHVSSATLGEIGVTKEIVESGDYNELGKKVRAISDEKERNKMRKATLSPEYVIGSVHAITEDGEVFIASATGSQIPPYVYGASNVIWVVGAQKIVRSRDDAFRRIYEYALEMESERMRKAYGMKGSSVNKILIYEKERPSRVKIIIVKEKLGF